MKKAHWQDWATIIVGICLFVTPWVLATKSASVAWNFWIVGAVIVLLALFETAAFDKFVEWTIAALATWMVLSPHLLNFSTEALALSATIGGLIIVAFSGWAIGDAHEILPKPSRPANDLRGDMEGIALPDEHEHLAGASPRRPDSGPNLVSPGVGVQSPGQISHE
jgi:FtsH-binding integral membrane protein